MNQYGIFLDNSHAYILKYDAEDISSIEEIKSEVESKNKGQYTDEHVTIANQHKNMERRTQEFKHFFKAIIEKVKDAKEILIFGPAMAKKHFQSYVEDIDSFKKTKIELSTIDDMTENQMKAYVKEYFIKIKST